MGLQSTEIIVIAVIIFIIAILAKGLLTKKSSKLSEENGLSCKRNSQQLNQQPQQQFNQQPKQPVQQPQLKNDFRPKAEKLKDLKALLDAGVLTQEEFDSEKKKILDN